MWQEWLIDLRAALHLKHPEALEAALQRIAAQPELAANARIPLRLEHEFLLPAARLLAQAALPAERLRALCQAPLAGLRALGGAALAFRGCQQQTPSSELLSVARDARPDVRRAAGHALAEAGASCPQVLLRLAGAWLAQDSPRLQHTAMLALHGAVATCPGKVLSLLRPLPSPQTPEGGDAQVALLQALGNAGHGEALLSLLEAWAQAETPNLWLIGRTLSGKWAARHAARVAMLLEALAEQHGESRHISNARRALKRHVRV